MSKESFEFKASSLPAGEVDQEAKLSKRTEREMAELRDKMRFIARVLAGNYNLKVVPGDGWAAGLSEKFTQERLKHPEKSLEEFEESLLVPEVLTYPEKDLLEKSEDYLFGVFRHEVGHLKHSDYWVLMEFQERAKKEGYHTQDAFMIFDAWEDGRSNIQEAKESRAAKHRLASYIKEDLALPLMKELESKPLPIQYAILCWARGAERFAEECRVEEIKKKITDPEVLGAYEKTEVSLDNYLDEHMGRRAFEEYLWKEAWPIFKDLIQKYVEEEAEKQHKISIKIAGKEGSGDWDDLNQEEKNKFREEAREKLDEAEKEITIILQPKSIEIKEKEDGNVEVGVRVVSPEVIGKSEEESEKESVKKIRTQTEERKRIREAQQKLREKLSGLTEREQAAYNQYYQPVKKYVDVMVKRLDEIFPPQEEEGWRSGYRRGKKIDVRRLAREAPTESGKFFMKKEVPEKRNLVFKLLIDVSGSMRDESKIENALKASIMMSEALSTKGIPFEIQIFHSQHLTLKNFDEPYKGKKKLELMKMLKEVSSEEAYCTDAGFALDEAARCLQKKLLEDKAQGALIMFTDGAPAPTGEHDIPEYELKGVVDKWSQRLPLIGVGIGKNSTEVLGESMEKMIKYYYDRNGLVVEQVNKLPGILLKILGQQVERFTKRGL